MRSNETRNSMCQWPQWNPIFLSQLLQSRFAWFIEAAFWHNFTNSAFRFPSPSSPSWISRCDKYFFSLINVTFIQLQFCKTWGAISKWKERSRAYEQAKETLSVRFELALGRFLCLPASKLLSTNLTCQLLQFNNFHFLWEWLSVPNFPRSFCYLHLSQSSVVDFRVNQRLILRSFVSIMQCHYFLQVWNCLCVCKKRRISATAFLVYLQNTHNGFKHLQELHCK